jgi:hypothetical protein
MSGPMGLSEDRQEEGAHSANFQTLAIQNVLASQQGANLFQFQPIPADIPQLQRTDLERQRQAAPNQLLVFVASGDQDTFTARGNELGLVDPSSTYHTAEQLYLNEARNQSREGARSAITEGNQEARDIALGFLSNVHRRIVGQEETPEERNSTAAQLTREDATYMASSCTNDQCRTDLLNALAAEGFHAQTLMDLSVEWQLGSDDQTQRPNAQLSLDGGRAFEAPIMLAVQEQMREQLDEIRKMQERGASSAEIQRSEAFQQLAAAAGIVRSGQMVNQVGQGEDPGTVARERSEQMLARSLLDSGRLNVIVPSRRQVG